MMRQCLCVVAVALLLAGCGAHPSPVQPSPVPPPVLSYPTAEPQIVQFTTSHSVTELGYPVSLTIVTAHAEQCVIDGVGPVTCAGVVTLPVDDDSREHGWTLHASNRVGEATASVSVKVRLIDVMYRITGNTSNISASWLDEYGTREQPVYLLPFEVSWEHVTRGRLLRLTAGSLELTVGHCFVVEIWTDRVLRATQRACGNGGPVSATVSAVY